MHDKEKEVAQWDQWLVNAVQKIRSQKQRPALDRIYNSVRLLAEKEQLAVQSQRSPIAPIYNAPFETIGIDQVQRHIDRAVKKGLLLKIISKGCTAYKTPEKCERQLNLSNGSTEENPEVIKSVVKVFRELSEPDPTATSSSRDSNSNGCTLVQISDYLRQSHIIQFPATNQDLDNDSLVRRLVEGVLRKEISKGHVELHGEHYRLLSGGNGGSGSGGNGKSSVSSSSSDKNNMEHRSSVDDSSGSGSSRRDARQRRASASTPTVSPKEKVKHKLKAASTHTTDVSSSGSSGSSSFILSSSSLRESHPVFVTKSSMIAEPSNLSVKPKERKSPPKLKIKSGSLDPPSKPSTGTSTVLKLKSTSPPDRSVTKSAARSYSNPSSGTSKRGSSTDGSDKSFNFRSSDSKLKDENPLKLESVYETFSEVSRNIVSKPEKLSKSKDLIPTGGSNRKDYSLDEVSDSSSSNSSSNNSSSSTASSAVSKISSSSAASSTSVTSGGAVTTVTATKSKDKDMSARSAEVGSSSSVDTLKSHNTNSKGGEIGTKSSNDKTKG
ncbi:unnamed protein product [Allacma fusca]|uniref:SAMD1-like winged helix (WH) domain-containing protein n=1 Tax=Allacma fusca TaxID=39272 RepID=A0A8J2LL84_9HEXA|nr:unnamed protein product [Allacma fusca]